MKIIISWNSWACLMQWQKTVFAWTVLNYSKESQRIWRQILEEMTCVYVSVLHWRSRPQQRMHRIKRKCNGRITLKGTTSSDSDIRSVCAERKHFRADMKQELCLPRRVQHVSCLISAAGTFIGLIDSIEVEPMYPAAFGSYMVRRHGRWIYIRRRCDGWRHLSAIMIRPIRY